MVGACSPPAREAGSSGLSRRSTMATSTPASASSAASIIPVGPPPAITTACPAMLQLADRRVAEARDGRDHAVLDALGAERVDAVLHEGEGERVAVGGAAVA